MTEDLAEPENLTVQGAAEAAAARTRAAGPKRLNILSIEDVTPPEPAPADKLPSDDDSLLPSDRDPNLAGEEAGLAERYRLHTVDAFYRGTLAGSLRMRAMSHFVANPDAPDTAPEVKKARDKLRAEYRDIVGDLGRFDLMAEAGAPSEYGVALAGQVVGSLPSPESVIGVASKGATALIRTGKAALQQGAIQLATDPAVQGLSISGGTQKEYEPIRTALAPVIGAVIGGGLHAGGELLTSTMLKRIRAEAGAEDPSMRAAGDENVTTPAPDVTTREPSPGNISEIPAGDVTTRPGEVTTPEGEGLAAAVASEPSLTAFLSERFGPKWEVRDRMTAKVREEVENPVSRKDYEKAVREWVAANPEAAKAQGGGVYERFKPKETSDDTVPLISEGVVQALAARQSGGSLPMERARPTAGVSNAPTTTGTAVATVAPNPSPQETAALRSLQQQANDLADAIGFPLREGRMGSRPKQVLGFLKTRSGVVRVREIADLEVVAHEGGHYIELRAGNDLTDLTEQFAGELAPLVSNPAAYDPSKYVKEGFAEYIRRFVGNPAHAAQVAPGFAAAFRNFMETRHPDIMRTLDGAAAAYKAYLDAPSVDAIGAVRRSVSETPKGWRAVVASVKENGFGGTIKNVLQWSYQSWSDRDAPLARAVREINLIAKEANGGVPIDLKAADNPEVLQRLFARTEQASVRDMMDGVRPYRGVEPEGPSLSQALSKAIGAPTAFGRWDEGLRGTFSTYLIARRAEYMWRKFEAGLIPNPPAAFSKADAVVAMADLERAHPDFREASDMVHAYTRQLLRKGYEGHQIGADLYQRLLNEEFYVPFQRDLSDKPLADGDPARKGAADRTPDIVQTFRGSTRDIKDPLESLMLQTFLVNRAIRHNDVILALKAHAGRAGFQGGKYFEDIPAHEAKKITFDLGEAIERKAIEKGMDPTMEAPLLKAMMTDLFGEDPLLGSFYKMEPAGKRGEPIVFYKEGGELKAARLMSGSEGHALYETLTAMPQALSDLGLQVLSVGSSVLRSGIVLNPTYALTNYIRDQVAASIIRPDYIPFVSGMKGIKAELQQGQSAKLYGYAGGVSAGAAVAPVQQAAEANVQALAKQGWTVQRFQSLHSFLEGTQVTEAGTRNSVFSKVYDKKRTQGLSEYEAMIEAAYAAQDLMDFSRWGDKTQAIRALTPFVNSHIQGLDKGYRTMIEPLIREAATTADQEARRNAVIALTKAVAVGSALGAGWAALHSADRIYQNALPEMKGTHFVTSVGGNILIIPKPFELSLGFTAGEYAYQRLMKEDPRAAEQFAKAAFEVLAPPVPIFANPLIKTSAELALGKSFFTGRDLVPERLQRLEPSLQYTDRTSELSKMLGNAIGVSPIKVEHAIGGYFGLWGRDVMALSSGISEDTPTQSLRNSVFFRRFLKDPTLSSDVNVKFWNHMGQTTGKYNQAVASYDALIGRRSLEGEAQAREFLAKLPSAERAFVILRSGADDDGKPAFNADQKRLHPLQRAYDAATMLNGVRQELNDNRFFSFESGERMNLSRKQRGDLGDAVRELGQMELNNALTITKEPGYANQALLDLSLPMAKIRSISPAAADEISTRYATAKIYKTDLVAKAYPAIRDALLQQGSEADLSQYVERDYEFGGERVKKPQKRRVPIQARQ